jgi:hypothetical protein
VLPSIPPLVRPGNHSAWEEAAAMLKFLPRAAIGAGNRYSSR